MNEIAGCSLTRTGAQLDSPESISCSLEESTLHTLPAVPPVAGIVGPQVSTMVRVYWDFREYEDSIQKIDLHIQGFSGWNTIDLNTMQSALERVAIHEFDSVSSDPAHFCADPLYLAGLSHYLDRIIESGPAAPFEPKLIHSILRHTLKSCEDHHFEQKGLSLFDHQNDQIREEAWKYFFSSVDLAREDRYSAGFGKEIYAKMERELSSVPAQYQDRLVQFLLKTPWHSSSMSSGEKAVIKLGVGEDASVIALDRAIKALDALNTPLLEKLLRRRWDLMQDGQEGLGTSRLGYSAGLAAAFALENDPDNQAIRKSCQKFLNSTGSRGDGPAGFTRGMLMSGSIPAVAMAMEVMESSVGYLYHDSKIFAAWRERYENIFASTQRDREINRIMYHLESGHEPITAAGGVRALLASGEPRAISFVHAQARNPPNPLRGQTIREEIERYRKLKKGIA